MLPCSYISMSKESEGSRQLLFKFKRVDTANWRIVESASSKMAPRKLVKKREEVESAEAGVASGMASGVDTEELPIAKGQRSKRKKDEAAVAEGGAQGGAEEATGRKKRKTKAEKGRRKPGGLGRALRWSLRVRRRERLRSRKRASILRSQSTPRPQRRTQARP